MDLTETASATFDSDGKYSLHILPPRCVVTASQVYRFVGNIKQSYKVTT